MRKRAILLRAFAAMGVSTGLASLAAGFGRLSSVSLMATLLIAWLVGSLSTPEVRK